MRGIVRKKYLFMYGLGGENMAIYNGGYPVTYPQMYYPQIQMPQPQQQAQQQAQQPNSGMVWVQGEAGAKSYLLTPNTILPLWDSEAQTIYLKSTDASGMPTMKILDYTVRDGQQSNPPIQNSIDFATKEEDMKNLLIVNSSTNLKTYLLLS